MHFWDFGILLSHGKKNFWLEIEVKHVIRAQMFQGKKNWREKKRKILENITIEDWTSISHEVEVCNDLNFVDFIVSPSLHHVRH